MSVQFDFSKLETSINRAVKSLDALDKRISILAKNANTFDRLFGSTTNFDKFIDSLKKLDQASSINFRTVAVGLTEIAGALNLLESSDSNFGGLIRQINTLVTATSLLAGLKTSASITPLLNNVIKPLADFSKNIGNLGTIGQLGRSLQGVAEFFNSVGKFNIDNIQKSFIGRIPVLGKYLSPTPIRKLAVSLKQFADAFRDIHIPDNIGSSFAGIGKFLNSLSKVDVSQLGGSIKQRIPVIGGVFRSISNFFRPPDIVKVANALKGFSAAFKGIKIPANVGSTFSGLSDFLRSFQKLDTRNINVSVISKIPIIGNIIKPNKFIQLGKTIKQLIGSFKGIDVKSLSGFFSGLGSFVKFVSNEDFTKIDLSGFNDFTKNLGKGLENLSNSKIDTGKLNSIGNVLVGLKNAKGIQGLGINAVQQASSFGGGVIENAVGQFLGQVAFDALSRVGGFLRKLITFDQQIGQTLRSVGQSISTFGSSLQSAGQNLLSGFGIGKLFSSPLTQVAADFDHLSNEVQVFGNLTDQELQSAQAFADQIGIKYPQSANDALQATLDLIKAGQDLNSIKFILPSAADLATLGEIDIPTATGALITATSVFSKFTDTIPGTFQNISTAADLFSAAADKSRATVGGLIEGLTNVAPAAQQIGLSLQETVAALAEFNDAGIQGAEAGTQLSQVFNAFLNPKAVDELAFLSGKLQAVGSDIQLGISNADGSLRSFDDVIKSLGASYKTLNFTQAQVLDSLSKISGPRARQGLAILLQKNGINEFIDQMNGVDTAANRTQVILNDFKGDVTQLQGSVETLVKNALIPLLNQALRPIVQVARKVVDGILSFNQALAASGKEGLFNLVSNVILLTSSLATLFGSLAIGIGVILKFQGVLFSVAGTFITLIRSLPLIVFGFGGFVAAAGILVISIAAVGTAILGISLLITELRRVISQNVSGAGFAFERLQATIQTVLGTIGPTISKIAEVFNLLFGGIFQRESNSFGSRVASFLDRINLSLSDLYFTIQQVGAGFEVFGDFIRASFGGQTPEEISKVNDELSQLATLPLIQKIFGSNANVAGLRKIFSQLQKGFQIVGQSLDDILSGGLGILFGEPDALKKVKTGLASLLSLASKAFQKLTGLDFADAILNFDQGRIGVGIESLLRTVLGKVRDFFISKRYEIARVISDAFGFTASAPFDIAAFVLRILGLDQAADFVQGIGRTINDLIHRGIDLAIRLLSGDISISIDPGAFFSNLFSGNNFTIAVDSLAQNVKDIVVTALGKIPSLLQSIGSTLGIQPLVDFGVSLESSQAFSQISDALGNIASYPLKAISDVFTGIKDVITALQGTDTSGIAAFGVVIATIAASSGAVSTVLTLLKSLLFGAVLPAFGIITLVSAIGNLGQLLKDGNLGDFIKNTLADIAKAVLSFFGIDMSRGTILENVQTAFEALRDNLPGVIDQIGKKVSDSIGSIAYQIVNALESLRAKLDLALPGAFQSGFGQQFFDLQNQISGIVSGQSTPDQLFAALQSSQIDPVALQSLAAANSGVFIKAFSDAITNSPDVASIPSALFVNMTQGLSKAGILDEALAALPSQDIRDTILDRILGGGAAATPPQISDPTIQALSDVIQQAYVQALVFGQVNPQDTVAVGDFISSFIQASDIGSVTKDQIQQIVASALTSGVGGLEPASQDFVNAVTNQIKSSFQSAPPVQIPLKVDIISAGGGINFSNLAFNIASGFQNILSSITSSKNFSDLAELARFSASSQIPTHVAGRGNGGELKPNSAYGVHDTPSPEVAMFNDGTSILLTGQAGGRMVKLIGRASAPAVDITSLNSGSSAALDAERAAAKKQRTQQAKDNTKQIENIQQSIVNAELDFLQKEYKLNLKFQKDELKAQAEFEHNRAGIIDTGHETLLDAIRRGDGAAALAASKEAHRQIKELEYNFTIQKQERADQLKDQQDADQAERQQKLDNYALDLQQLNDQNDQLASDQADADQTALDEQAAFQRSQEDQNAQHNANIEDQNGKSYQTLLQQAIQTKNAMLGASAVIAGFNQLILSLTPGFQRAESALSNLLTSVGNQVNIAINNIKSAPTLSNAANQIGQLVGNVANSLLGGSSQTLNLPTALSVGARPVGAPANPATLQTYKDPGGQLWLWTGKVWQTASSTPGHAGGGIVPPYSAGRVFDSNRSELMTMNNGQSLLLTGKNSARVVPLPPNQNGSGSAPNVIHVEFGDIISNATDPMEVAMQTRNIVIPEVREIVNRANSANRSKSLLRGNT